MISLSLQSTAHPVSFQPQWVRTSTRYYPRFILAMDRSHRFRVYVPRLIALIRLAFASATPIGLTSPRNVTRRPIMQKVRSHTLPGPKAPAIVLPLLVGIRFQVLFTPLAGVLFTFPSRYWFTIGHQGVLSLGRWSSQLRTGFHVSRPTREHPRAASAFGYGAITLYGRPFQVVLLASTVPRRGPTTPGGYPPGLGWSAFARRY